MSLLAALERCEGDLTPVERRLTTALLAAPTEAAFLSVQELAQRAGADAAAAVRLAKKLGYSGYRDLKASLQSELVNANASHARLRRSVEPEAPGGVLAGLIDAEIEALMRLRGQMADARIRDVVEAVRMAKRIVIYGQGHAVALVDLLARRLNRHGYPAIAIREGQWAAPEAVASLGHGDVVIAFALYRMPEILNPLFAHADTVGANTVLITDLVGNNTQPPARHILAAVRGKPGQSHSLGVPMLIVNAIMLMLTRVDGGRSLAALQRLDAITLAFMGKSRTEAARGRRQKSQNGTGAFDSVDKGEGPKP